MRVLQAAVVIVILAAAVQAPLGAVDFVVTRYDDPAPNGCNADDCSLREAVIAANADSAFDRIVLSAGTYVVDRAGAAEDQADTGDLDLLQDVWIVGVGAPLTILDGTGLGESFFSSTGGAGLEATFSDLTLRNADVAALQVFLGWFVVERCEIRESGTTGTHAAVVASLFSELTILDSTITGSTGPGLAVSQSALRIENSTVTGNGQQEVTITNGATLHCDHCTIADPLDDGFEVLVSGASATFGNSVVLGNCSLVSASTTTNGGNVESPADTCAFDDTDDAPSVADVELGALAANGGPTRTLNPSATSPLLGAATIFGCPIVDQRGSGRPLDGVGCDSGAVERAETDPPTPLFVDGFEQGDPEAWSATGGV